MRKLRNKTKLRNIVELYFFNPKIKAAKAEVCISIRWPNFYSFKILSFSAPFSCLPSFKHDFQLEDAHVQGIHHLQNIWKLVKTTKREPPQEQISTKTIINLMP